MATYLYRCDCMKHEVEVSQPMSEGAFVSCLQVYERLGVQPPPKCAANGGCRAERLIAGSVGVIAKGPRQSCSLGDRASTCGCRCASAAAGPAPCPFG